jgi:BirA family biotin operon repressor/biotin-[acetyl-CoA-carboxylase] ligase
MKLIKLDAIDSTNDFLKGMSSNQVLQNFTVVTAQNQTKGKGQMGSEWSSEPSKNLIMSVLVKDFLFDTIHLFAINIAFSLAVIQALESIGIPELSIKWPNDIMSYNKKIGGILIENSIKSDGNIHSVAGLGLNINQTDFKDLPKASSLAVICNSTFDKEVILLKIIENLKKNSQSWSQNSEAMWKDYTNILFKKGIPMPFSDPNNKNFMGIIKGVNSIGQLEILHENDTISEYGIKEIRMLY